VSNSNFLNGDMGITGLVILNFSKQIIVSLVLLFALSSSSIVLPCYILFCASLHIFYELDCLLREIILNSFISVRPVW
jgi:hypothetical protein